MTDLDQLQRRWENARSLRVKHRLELMMERAAAREMGISSDGKRAEPLEILNEWRRAIEVSP